MITQVKKKKREPVASIALWLKIMSVAFAFALVAVVLVGYVERNSDNGREARALDNRIVESCHNYNRDQTKGRLAAHRNLFALARISGRPFDESNLDPELALRLAEYDTEMAEFFTYRKCDLVCAKAAINKDTPDCAPSDNEEGT